MDNDSTSLIEVAMINQCKKCFGGPDYTDLFVIHDSDTLGSVAINGIPRYNKSARVYPAFCGVELTALPDIKELRISLDQYCDDVPIDLNSKTRHRDKLFREN